MKCIIGTKWDSKGGYRSMNPWIHTGSASKVIQGALFRQEMQNLFSLIERINNYGGGPIWALCALLADFNPNRRVIAGFFPASYVFIHSSGR